MSIVWTAARVWLGIMWLQAGVAKIWGVENLRSYTTMAQELLALPLTVRQPIVGGDRFSTAS